MSETASSILQVNGLRHHYGRPGQPRTVAVENITFAVQPGEIVSIVGPSGCGKTTLLRSIAGLLVPTGGEVRVADRQVCGATPGELAMVFQDYSRSLFPWMRIGRNVEFPLETLGIAKAERRSRVAQAIEAVGLASYRDHYPWQLSGGMQQRVAIARALARQPRLLVMDEPFASVDAQTRASLEDLVLSIHQRFRNTILFVTHDIDESVYLSDRILVLSKSPSAVAATFEVPLSRPRDQVATKAEPIFVEVRRAVADEIRRVGLGGAHA